MTNDDVEELLQLVNSGEGKTIVLTLRRAYMPRHDVVSLVPDNHRSPEGLVMDCRLIGRQHVRVRAKFARWPLKLWLLKELREPSRTRLRAVAVGD